MSLFDQIIVYLEPDERSGTPFPLFGIQSLRYDDNFILTLVLLNLLCPIVHHRICFLSCNHPRHSLAYFSFKIHYIEFVSKVKVLLLVWIVFFSLC